MNWLFNTLRTYPEIAIFLALSIGFYVGGLKFGKFSLGSVTGVLLVGVLIGQLNITISPNVKALFFLMFLFAVGYSVGPQFFRGLKSDGLPQVFFAFILSASCLLSAFAAAKLAGYNMGQAAGLLSGACTCSAVLGVASDTISQQDLPQEKRQSLIAAMPAAYAVTYIFGTAGSAWFLAIIGPKLLRVNLAKACAEYEAQMGGGLNQGDSQTAYRRLTLRSYAVDQNSVWLGKSVRDFEAQFTLPRIFVVRLRQESKIIESEPGAVFRSGDIVALAGPRELLLKVENTFGNEVEDAELVNFPVQILDVVITNKLFAGKSLEELRQSESGEGARGVFLRKLIRAGQEMPFTAGTTVDRGDVLQIVGPEKDVETVAKRLGYADRATDKTDVVFMGLGIGIGALIGSLSIKIGQVPISLSTSGGSLMAGLVCGYLRAVKPVFGRIPPAALWVFNNIGLTAFIAAVGISAGPSFVEGLKTSGVSLFLWGILVTTLPFVIAIYAGKYLFKMHPAIVLGACAGARTTTAALGAIQDEAKSKVPALGYTVPYAVGNVLLITWGVVIVLLMK